MQSKILKEFCQAAGKGSASSAKWCEFCKAASCLLGKQLRHLTAGWMWHRYHPSCNHWRGTGPPRSLEESRLLSSRQEEFRASTSGLTRNRTEHHWTCIELLSGSIRAVKAHLGNPHQQELQPEGAYSRSWTSKAIFYVGINETNWTIFICKGKRGHWKQPLTWEYQGLFLKRKRAVEGGF